MKKKYLIAVLILSMVVAGGVAGCKSAGSTAGSTSSTSSSTQSAAVTAAASTTVTAADITYDDDDTNETWSEEDATTISLSGSLAEIDGDGASEADGIITINDAGTYVISGTLSDGQLVIDAGSDDVVHLILNGASITSSDGAAINAQQSGKLVITLAEGTENKITDGSTYSELDDSDEPDAAIFSKDDITINGSGSLTVKGNYKNGIHSKDGLKIVNGTITVDAANHTLSGKDYVAVGGGTLNLTSTEDTIHSATDVSITDGSITINAGDDGIHADSTVTIDGGTIKIEKSNEGIEGTVVTINGGDVSVTASDDGINGSNGLTGDSTDETTTEETTTDQTTDATNQPQPGDNAGGEPPGNNPGRGGDMGGSMENDESVLVEINGGTLYINAEGDSIDSNGSLSITGGDITIDGTTQGGNGIMDYNGTAEITGGTITGVGTSDMAQLFSDSSTQYSLLYGFDSTQSAGTKITLKDSSGNEAASITSAKTFGAVLISSSKLTEGGTYTLYAGDTKVADITLDSVNTTAGTISGGMGGSQGGMGGGQNGMDNGQGGPGGNMGNGGPGGQRTQQQ